MMAGCQEQQYILNAQYCQFFSLIWPIFSKLMMCYYAAGM